MAQKLARERIEKLFELAQKRASDGEMELADRYVELARDIGMKQNVPVPENLRKKFCENCKSFLVPGRNCSVRVNSKNRTVNYLCDRCNHVNRHGY